ncbi:helix-turn-helix domain-containing protein [Sciscionella marina]|uniref:helix-turn-helix domain-containing protein n=1 Tax=Sciscionella marina TaxID=508770 RepID=UPI00037014CD|nr:helix-turn-helix domain-containing protein [Sciscionella marina]
MSATNPDSTNPASSNPVELLHHPVRWRITQSLIGRALTTGQLAELLDDVPPTSLYRHVAKLVRAEVLTVTSERRVRGAVERTYALRAEVEQDESVDRERLRAMVTVFIAGVTGDFDRYLEREQLDPVADGVTLRQSALLLTDEEFADFLARYVELLQSFTGKAEVPGRSRRILSTVLVPGD